jgi:hypothetical protein
VKGALDTVYISTIRPVGGTKGKNSAIIKAK